MPKRKECELIDYSQVTQHSIWAYKEGELDDFKRENVRQLRERLQQSGVTTLSSTDLLSIVLGTGSSTQSMITQVQILLSSNSLQELLQLDFGEMCRKYLLGEVKTAQLQAVLELARRLTVPTQTERYQIRSPADAANLVMPDMCFLDHEELRGLYLDTKNRVVANIRLYQGTLNSSVLRITEILRPAITRNCAGLIVCHNHPSGDPAPSPEDESATKQLAAAATMLDLELVDHIIIGSNNRFCSLKEKLMW
jgi:DNA repair protein RadC